MAPGRRGTGDANDAFVEGIRHLTSFLLEPGGHLPYDRQRELRSFLTTLGAMALSDTTDPLRERLSALLAEHPIAEMVPQFFYEVIAGEPR
ncbi:hypothetical protein GCM10029963_24390 [Micromonospora andamanensis]